MHLLLLGLSLGLALFLRRQPQLQSQTWTQRWQQAWVAMIIPPLLLLMSAIAVIWMGPKGQMLGQPTGWLSYGLAWGFCAWGIVLAGGLWLQATRSLQQIRHYPIKSVNGITVRLLEQPILFCAQIGLWHCELVVSQELLNSLNIEQQNAVLTHEQAHRYYRDTFWFFWLGWCRRLTAWLPQTDVYWEELLLLRELRADQWAARQVDPLLLAESLLLMVRHPLSLSMDHCAPFSALVSPSRFTERIEALLTPSEPSQLNRQVPWRWMILIVLPLLSIPFHHYF